MAREAEQQLEGGLVQRLSLRLRLLLQAHAVRAEQQRGGRGAELLRGPRGVEQRRHEQPRRQSLRQGELQPAHRRAELGAALRGGRQLGGAQQGAQQPRQVGRDELRQRRRERAADALTSCAHEQCRLGRLARRGAARYGGGLEHLE